MTGLLFLKTHGCKHCQTCGSQFSKMNRPIFFLFQIVCSCKTQVTAQKNLSPSLGYGLVELEGNSCSSTSLKKNKASSTSLWDKWQFVNSVKHLVFDLVKIPFLKCLIDTSHLIVEVLNDQNLLQNWIWLIDFGVMSSFARVIISQNKLKLLGSVEKWITLTIYTAIFGNFVCNR